MTLRSKNHSSGTDPNRPLHIRPSADLVLVFVLVQLVCHLHLVAFHPAAHQGAKRQRDLLGHHQHQRLGCDRHRFPLIMSCVYLSLGYLGATSASVLGLSANGGVILSSAAGIFFGPMALSIVVVMFSFGGIELIGITAGEAADPDRTIPKAINQVIWRILIFYVGTMLIMLLSKKEKFLLFESQSCISY